MQKHHDPKSLVSYREQNRAAWLALFKEIRKFLSVVLPLAAVGYLVFLGARWLDSHNYVDLAIRILVVVLCVVGPVFLLWLRKESLRGQMFGAPKEWITNLGQPPEGVERVSVERKDGKKEWNVAVTDIEWGLDEENPVKTYYPKQA